MDDPTGHYNQFLEALAAELDISPRKYKQAVDRYESVGRWLDDGEYEGCQDKPHCYTQGSFRLGTVVRPFRFGGDAGFDIDLVCELKTSKGESTPKKVKSAIGDRLKEHGKYKKMLDEEGRRCWTIEYAESDGVDFHLDVLPAAPEDSDGHTSLVIKGVSPNTATKAIAITHKEHGTYSWRSSNPNGYSDWFAMRQMGAFERIQLSSKRAILRENRKIFASVDDVPDMLVRTPLQRVIQILKRHRDVRFSERENESDKPISMIITTLSAHLYNNETDTLQALQNIVNELHRHAALLHPSILDENERRSLSLIQRDSVGGWTIPNPVNPNENFADRWHENNDAKANAFFQWVDWVKADLLDILDKFGTESSLILLQESLGDAAVKRTADRIRISFAAPAIIVPGRTSAPRVKISNPAKPWGRDA